MPHAERITVTPPTATPAEGVATDFAPIPEPMPSQYFTEDKVNQTYTPSGCMLLDCALGGGWADGLTINIVGDHSSGKTLLGIEACTNFLLCHPHGHVWYEDAEAAFNQQYAAMLGMPVGRVIFGMQPEPGVRPTIEELESQITAAVNTCLDADKATAWKRGSCKHANVVDDKCAQSAGRIQPQPQPGFMVVDSLDAVTATAELERDFADTKTYGAEKARKLSELFRRQAFPMASANLTLCVISQTRDNIGVMFGAKYTRTGGRALNYYASQIVYLSERKKIKRTIQNIERVTGVEIKARVTKSKVGLPFRECLFPIHFGYGIDDLTANLTFLNQIGQGDQFIVGDLTDFVKKVRSTFSPEEYTSLCNEVAGATKQRWNEIERKFLPTRSKYQQGTA